MTSAIRYMTQHASLRKQKLGAQGLNFQFPSFFFSSFFPANAKIRQPGGNFLRKEKALGPSIPNTPLWSVERRLARAGHRWGGSDHLHSFDGLRSVCPHRVDGNNQKSKSAATLLSHNLPPVHRLRYIDHDLGATGTSRIRQLPSDVTKH